MREIRQVKRYGCSFCKITGPESKIKAHEPRCFFNPERESCNCYPRGQAPDDPDCPWCEKWAQFVQDRFDCDWSDFELLTKDQKILMYEVPYELANQGGVCKDCYGDVRFRGKKVDRWGHYNDWDWVCRQDSKHVSTTQEAKDARTNLLQGIMKGLVTIKDGAWVWLSEWEVTL